MLFLWMGLCFCKYSVTVQSNWLLEPLPLQEVLISPLCVVSQGQCLGKTEAKLIPPFIPSRYAFLSMVGTFSFLFFLSKCMSLALVHWYILLSTTVYIYIYIYFFFSVGSLLLMNLSSFHSCVLDLLIYKWSWLGWSLQTAISSS